MSQPNKVKAFKEWATMMVDQAKVPDRVQYKKSVKGAKSPRKQRRKRIRRMRRKPD